MNSFITLAAIFTFVGQWIFIWNFVYSLIKGKKLLRTRGNLTRWSGQRPSIRVMATGRVKYRLYIAGPMTIANQEQRMTSFLRMFLIRRRRNLICRMKTN
jgi:hypothetical protein